MGTNLVELVKKYKHKSYILWNDLLNYLQEKGYDVDYDRENGFYFMVNGDRIYAFNISYKYKEVLAFLKSL